MAAMLVAFPVPPLTGQPAKAAPPEAFAAVPSYAPMLARVLPAVVTIRVMGETFPPVDLPRRNADGSLPAIIPPAKTTFRSGGSGVVVDPARGLIMTNNHVIENATWIQVGLANGRRMMAELVGRDIGTDVAVLRVKEKDLPGIAVGDSDAMQVGDLIVAVGNPFGLEGTATMGIVSAVMRGSIGHGPFEDYLQVDAPINPGNSGGALVNLKGELVGINTVTAGGPGTNLGIGFAIPINMATTIMDELIAAGRMRRGSPGLIVEDLPEEISSPPGGGVIRGALVTKVLPGSSAAGAGVAAGDIVVSAAGKPVRSAAEYITRTVTVPLGSRIPMILFSRGQGKVVTLEANDVVLEPQAVSLPPAAGDVGGAEVGDILLGNPLYGDVRGAQVLKVPAGSPAYALGLVEDDVIVGVDNANVRSVEDLFRRVAAAGAQYRLKILRNGQTGWLRARR
jgi:serine protease DegQ